MVAVAIPVAGVTWAFTLRGRPGTYGNGLALMRHLVPVCRRGRRGCLHGKHGRRDTSRHGPSFCVAGLALGDMHGFSLFVAGAALQHWAGSGDALGSRLPPWLQAVCVAGVALGDMHLHSA